MTECVANNYVFNPAVNESADLISSSDKSVYDTGLFRYVKKTLLSHQSCTNPLLNVNTLANEMTVYLMKHPKVDPNVLESLTDKEVTDLTEKVRYRKRAVKVDYSNNESFEKTFTLADGTESGIEYYTPISEEDFTRLKDMPVLPKISYLEFVNESVVPEFMDSFVAEKRSYTNSLENIMTAFDNLNASKTQPITEIQTIAPKKSLVQRIKSYLSRNKNKEDKISEINAAFGFYDNNIVEDGWEGIKERYHAKEETLKMIEKVKQNIQQRFAAKEDVSRIINSISNNVPIASLEKDYNTKQLVSEIKSVKLVKAETPLSKIRDVYDCLPHKMIKRENFERMVLKIGLKNALRANESFKTIDDVINEEVSFLPDSVKMELKLNSADVVSKYLQYKLINEEGLKSLFLKSADEVLEKEFGLTAEQLIELKEVTDKLGIINKAYDSLIETSEQMKITIPGCDLVPISQLMAAQASASGYIYTVQEIVEAYKTGKLEKAVEYLTKQEN
ncbi:MAG: hypothetical protein JW791_03355 [Nanoarchaeota archaeon]|nr:hypothetical protein [Nanoarchaeota archaeon]